MNHMVYTINAYELYFVSKGVSEINEGEVILAEFIKGGIYWGGAYKGFCLLFRVD